MIKIDKNSLIADILSLTRKKDLSRDDVYALKTVALLAGLLIQQLESERLKLVRCCRDFAKERYELQKSIRQGDEARKTGGVDDAQI